MDFNNNIFLHKVWDQSRDIITTRDIGLNPIDLDAIMASIFCPGPFYYYIVDFYDRELKYIHPNVEPILGLNSQQIRFNDIIDRIHPDDIEYVALAENKVLDFLYHTIGRDKVRSYKMSYCFRFRTGDGSYRLFQHQAIILSTDESGGFAKSLNIHTDISHLASENNRKALLMGIMGETNCYRLDVIPESFMVPVSAVFSKREAEIIRFIAMGMKNDDIAAHLYISPHTVKTHRKNILAKAGVKNTSELIARCTREGLL